MLKWRRSGEFQMRAGAWCISKAMVGGEPRYTLTHDQMVSRIGDAETHQILGVFGTAQEAMDKAREMAER